MTFQIGPGVHVERNERGEVVQLRHPQAPYRDAALAQPNAPKLAEAYLTDVAATYGFPASAIESAKIDPNAFEPARGTTVRLASVEDMMGTTVVGFAQYHHGLQVWEGGVTVVVQSTPLRVTSSRSSVHRDLVVEDRRPLLERKLAVPAGVPVTAIDAKRAPQRLGRLWLYRYEAVARHHREAAGAHAAVPTLPLPDVPASIHEGHHYVVEELRFAHAVPHLGKINWHAFVELETGAVLYLRALVAPCHGYVYLRDPPTKGNVGVTPTSLAGDLNPLRDLVTLPGLTPADPQPLSGEFVTLVDVSTPTVAPPTLPAMACDFYYDVPTAEFSAVSAYYHVDSIYRMMQSMGFDLASYFGTGTTFPIYADHRALDGTVNSQTIGNVAGDGIVGYLFGLAQEMTPIASAVNYRSVLHELSHHLLYSRVHSPNFGFAHSCGDSFNAILNDPGTLTPDRGLTHQWTFPNPLSYRRRHDRTVAADWGWGGPNDDTMYGSEQLLSSTMFRLYRAMGGDVTVGTAAQKLAAQQLAAQWLTYLLIRAVGSLGPSPITPSPTADVFVTALTDADVGTTSFLGLPGGLFHKMMRWSFEKQGLYRANGQPTTAEGAPPAVDVYIDDGRHGDYLPYEDVFWETTDIWNRYAADGGTTHLEPHLNVPNYVYVRIKNRGTQTANNVVVRGYHCAPGGGMSWPADWAPMTTASKSPPGGTLGSGATVIVGPFQWTPTQAGHECLMMAVSADDDPSNLEGTLPCASGPTPDWALVRFDNNIAQRNVYPFTSTGEFMKVIRKTPFWIRYAGPAVARLELVVQLPTLLRDRGWTARFDNPGGAAFPIQPCCERQLYLAVTPGKKISPADVAAAKGDTKLRVLAYIDDRLVGGMTYSLEAKPKKPPKKRKR